MWRPPQPRVNLEPTANSKASGKIQLFKAAFSKFLSVVLFLSLCTRLQNIVIWDGFGEALLLSPHHLANDVWLLWVVLWERKEIEERRPWVYGGRRTAFTSLRRLESS